MRGGLDRLASGGGIDRTTPTYAGRTHPGRPDNHPPGITPACAGCGADTIIRGQMASMCGSPPRMQGGPTAADFHPRLVRITPACAGRTTGGWSPPPAGPGHPRVYGENRCDCFSLVQQAGTPPRVRRGQFLNCCRSLHPDPPGRPHTAASEPPERTASWYTRTNCLTQSGGNLPREIGG